MITSEFVKFRADHRPSSEEMAAKNYLAAIHCVKDDKVQMSVVKKLRTKKDGSVVVYRLVSDWYGDHLTSFILTSSGYHHVELWAETSKERLLGESDFEEAVKEISSRL